MAQVDNFNNEVLVWALGDAGYSPAELSERTRLDFQRIAELLAGGAKPQGGELRAIAKALHRPAPFFLKAQAPDRPPLSAAFRKSLSRDSASLLPREQTALRRARRLQRIARWAVEVTGEASGTLPGAKVASAASADAARTWLLWSVDEQSAYPSSNAVFRALRGRIEEQGVLVLSIPLSVEACRGFSMPDEVQPLIAVNSAFNPAARTFTLLHELAHLLRGDASLCDNKRDDEAERWCEQFAAEFLLPAEVLVKYVVAEFGESTKLSTASQASKTAGHFNVSLRAVAVRLERLGLAEPGLYNLVDQEVEHGGFGRSKDPATRPIVRLRELGTTFPRRLLIARDQGLLDDLNVCEYLSVSRTELQLLSEKLNEASSVGA